MGRLKIVEVRSWRELPEMLEPGVYVIAGERVEVLERVSRDALMRTLAVMRKRKGIYV